MKRLVLTAALLLVPLVVFAQYVGPPGPFEGFKSADKEPIEIHADLMELDLEAGLLNFRGAVQAKQGQRLILADRMDVTYTESGQVTRLEALGNVKVKMGDTFAVAGQLLLDNVKRVIDLTDRPRVVQGRQIITGEKITYMIDSDRIVVTRPRIEWTPETEPAKEDESGAQPEKETESGPPPEKAGGENP